MTTRTLGFGRLAALLALCLASCLTNEKQSNRGTVVDNELRSGILYRADGRPAVHARVRVFPVSHVPDSSDPVFSTRTDAAGRYTVDTLARGEYNILGELDGDRSYQDSIYLSASTDSLPSDTLGHPGSLAGILALQPNHNPLTATVQVLGTNSFSNVDAAGHFLLADLAAGRYTARALTTLENYTAYYFSIVIRSGGNDTLRDTIRLPYTGIPVVQGLKATYDTLKGAAYISWDRLAYPFLADYLVYRSNDDDLVPSEVPLGKSKDTNYVDKIFPSISVDPGSDPDTSVRRLQYRVEARSLSGEIGPYYGMVGVDAYSPDIFRTMVRFAAPTYAKAKDTVHLVVEYRNAVHSNVHLTWSQQGRGELKSRSLASRSGKDTLLWVADQLSSQHFRAEILDEAGKTWLNDWFISVSADPPQPVVPHDTTMWVGDTLHLRDLGKPGSGKIVSWKWRLPGDDFFTPVTGGDTMVIISGRSFQTFTLRVTDEFGQYQERSFTVSIPKVGTTWRSTSMELPYVAGRDVKRTCLPFNGKTWMFLSSWDESGVKPVQIWNSSDIVAWTRVTDSAAFPARVIRSATVYKGKMWVLGGEKTSGGPASFNDVWSSADGITWNLESTTSPVGTTNQGDYAFVVQDQLIVASLDGILWRSEDGKAWSKWATPPLRPSEITAAWTTSEQLFLSGKDGVRVAALSGLDLQSQWYIAHAPTGRNFAVTTLEGTTYENDGIQIYGYNANVDLYKFPDYWTSRLGGLYPHCFVGQDSALWSIQGGRFRNEPRAVDVYVSKGLIPN